MVMLRRGAYVSNEDFISFISGSRSDLTEMLSHLKR